MNERYVNYNISKVVLPKYASPVVTKYIKQLCPGYHDLVNAYYSNKRDEIQVGIKSNLYSYSYSTIKSTGIIPSILNVYYVLRRTWSSGTQTLSRRIRIWD